MGRSPRRGILIAKATILLVLIPVVVSVVSFFYSRNHVLNEDISFGRVMLLTLGPLLCYAALEMVAWSKIVHYMVQRLQRAVRQIELGGDQEPVFPELLPLFEVMRKKERLLADESDKISWIVRHIPGGLVTIDKHEIITFASCPAFERLGLAVDDLVGKPISVFHDQISVSRDDSPLLNALRKGIKSRRISRISDHYFEAVNTPMMTDDEAIDGAVCLFVDVTERVRQEAEMKRLEKLSLVGQMSASLSHEIRNPLTVIRGFLQLHSNRCANGTSRVEFDLLLAEVDRVSAIVQEFLALSHDRAGEWCQLPLSQLVGQLGPLLSSEASLHGVVFKLDLQETPPLQLNAGDIKQLLLNLYRNAIEACEGDGTVLVSTGVGLDNRPFLRVQDDGCGIPSNVLERMGMPFNSTKADGTGLGLPLCINVAEAHGAELTFGVAVPHGTVVTMLFPAIAQGCSPSCSGGMAADE